jgi:hypothetical protein
MIQIAEILLEQAPSPFWRALNQVGVNHAVGILPRRSFDSRGTSGELLWEYGPLALYKEQVDEADLTLSVIEDTRRWTTFDSQRSDGTRRSNSSARSSAAWGGSASRYSATTGWPSSVGCERLSQLPDALVLW